MKTREYGPEVPVKPVINKAEPTPVKKQPKRPASGYGPSLASKTAPDNHK